MKLSRISKAIAALVAALGVLGTSLPNGMSSTEWTHVIIAFLAALGVYAVPNSNNGPVIPPTDS